MFLQTHKQKSITEKVIEDINDGDVIAFNDPDAKFDAPEQLGIVYRKFLREGQVICIVVCPLTPVEGNKFEINPRAYMDDPSRRSVLKPKSRDLRDIGVNTNHYYTIGLSIKKYYSDRHVPDRDRIRCLSVTNGTVLQPDNGMVKTLQSVPAAVMFEINDRITMKFKADSIALDVFNGDLLNAAKDTLGIQRRHTSWGAKNKPDVVTKTPKAAAAKEGRLSVSKKFEDISKSLNPADIAARAGRNPLNRSTLTIPNRKR